MLSVGPSVLTRATLAVTTHVLMHGGSVAMCLPVLVDPEVHSRTVGRIATPG